MDYFLVLFIFVSTEDIIKKEDAENMFIRYMFGIISLKRSQKWIKFFHRVTLGIVHINNLPQRSKTSNMPMFLKTCKVGCGFKSWLQTPGGGEKITVQADQTLCKVLKYLKFCYSDVSSGWNVPGTVVDYCLGSLNMLSDFFEYLKNEWKIGYSGLIGYMNALGYLLDFPRTFSHSAS